MEIRRSFSRSLLPALSLSCAAALVPTLATAQATPAMEARHQASSEEAAALHLLRRATFGVRPEDLTHFLSVGRDAWLDRQLHPERIADPDLKDRVQQYTTVHLSMADLMRDYSPPPPQVRQAMRDSMGNAARPQNRQEMTPEMRREAQQRSPARIMGDLFGAKLARAVHSERQLEEVMVDFWFNHFNVFFGKGQDRYLIADYEKNAIRPHVFGRFEDMVIATASHPAMLFYLDNWTSAVPDSMNPEAQMRRSQAEQLLRRFRTMSPQQKDQLVRNGRITREQLERLERGELVMPALEQRARDRGINENYARELMELHTLGVDGGYTQKDVVEVARAFTGWTFRRPNGRGAQPVVRPFIGGRGGINFPPRQPTDVEFEFRPEMHDRGQKVVLGRTLPGGRGIEDGRDVIRMLAYHPSTARFIASKLVERFLTDEPAPEAVNELAGVFLDTRGDLRAVTRALFTSVHFNDERYSGAKVKTPFELVASALRVGKVEVAPSRRLMETLRAMGHLPYNEPAPTGFPAMSEDWVNAGAMLNRMNFGLTLAAGGFDGVRINPPALLGVDRPQADPEVLPKLLDTLLPGVETDKLQSGIQADIAGRTEDAPRAKLARAVGLIIGSPEFQKR